MQTVYSYLYPVMLAALAGAFVTALAPEKGNLKKYVRCIAGLALLAALILPFRDGISLETDSTEKEAYNDGAQRSSQDIIVGLYAERICGELERLCAEACGVGEDDITLSLTLDTAELSDIRITEIRVSAEDPDIQASAAEFIASLEG